MRLRLGSILGELAKLGISDISSTTIRRILKQLGLGPSPRKHRLTWDQHPTYDRHAA